MNATARTVQIDVDETHLIKGLRNAFSNRINTVAELLQNARRAGATQVTITDNESLFTVEDDGEGIADFQSLIRIGGTNWSEDINKVEGPYGLGILSAFFACKRIRIESRNTVLEADTQDILEKKLIALSSMSQFRKGVKVTLIDHDLRAGHADIMRLTNGFPLDVVFNGEPMPRPDAISAAFTSTPAGQLRFSFHDFTYRCPQLYLQGLPVSIHNTSSAGGIVLHLDPASFTGRFPDRNVLINDQEAAQRIAAAVKAAMHAELAEKKALFQGNAASFMGLADLCIGWECPELLDDVPLLPGAWFVDLAEQPLELTQEWGSMEVCSGSHVPQDVTGVITDDAFDAASEGFVGVVFAKAKGLPCMCSDKLYRLTKAHWIHQRLIDTSLFTIDVVDAKPPVKVDFDDESMSLIACSAFVIKHPGLGEVRIDDQAMSTGADYYTKTDENNRLLVPTKDCSVVRQVSRYLDDDDSYSEEIERLNENAFVNAYAQATGVDLAARFEMFVNQRMGYAINPEFAGRAFTIRLNTHGQIESVVETPPAV